uniref:Proteinase-activated receptor 1 n=2 Tax=Lepisosteus oculatus TaxID=7918 RepID=W5NML7_LEPOC
MTNAMPINRTSSISDDTLEMITSPYLTVVLPVIYLLVFIISTPCNVISLWLLCFHTKCNNPMIIFAINLSLTDLLYSIFLPFQIIYHLKGNDWPFGNVMCSVSTAAFYGNMNCSILTSCAISLERYCGIVKPLRTKHWRTARKASIVCILIWMFVLTLHIPILSHDLTFPVNQLNITTCFDILPKTLFPQKIFGYLYFGAVFLFFFFLPLIIFIICYSSIIKTLISSQDIDTKQSKEKTLYLIVVLVLCFIACYLPNMFLQVLHMIYKYKGQSLYIYYKLTLGINSLNCCFDPFVYYFASREFRGKLQQKLCCKFNGPEEQTTSNLSDQASAPLTSHKTANKTS